MKNLGHFETNLPWYARPIQRKGALALGQFQLKRPFYMHDQEGQKVVEHVYEYKITEQVLNYKDVEEREFSRSMWKDRASWNFPSARGPFREWVTRNIACLHFWWTDREDKTKIKKNFLIHINFWIYQIKRGSIVQPMM